MLRSLPRFVGATCLVLVLSCTLTLGAEPNKEVSHRFKISIASNLEIKIQDKKQKLVLDTELYYNWARSGRERVLSFESVLIKDNSDGKQLMGNFMNREQFTKTENGKTNVVSIATAPEKLKKMLQDSFGTPLCKLQVDGKGKEVKRMVVAGAGAKALIDNGMIANAVLFHPPFLGDHDEWQADTEISMGTGGYVKGKLIYKKSTGRKVGQTVKVSGKLTNEGFKRPGTPLIIKTTYVIRGEQTYDPNQQEWVSGRLSIDVSVQMTIDDKVVSTASGTMALNFKELPANK